MVTILPTVKKAGLIVLILFLYNICLAQLSKDSLTLITIEDARSSVIHSKVVGDDFKLYIHFPPGYDTSNVKYPVLYLTDGDWLFSMAIDCFNMLRQDYFTTEAITVAIGYGNKTNNRVRDLIPSNGAAKFLKFISTELIPYVEHNFRASQERTLYGYSFGGMFSTYALFQEPELFTHVLIGAPGNNGNELTPSAESYFKNHKSLKSNIFLTVGSYEPLVVNNINRFKNYMLAKRLSDMTIETAIIKGVGHGAAQAAVMQKAILFAYCKRHTRSNINPNLIKSLAGKYVLSEDPREFIVLVKRDTKLYRQFQDGSNVEYELVPESETSFFTYEDQKTSYTFKDDKNSLKKILVLALSDGRKFELRKS
ncbi:MAG: alpha/beta hydrolase-fold protein [Segetibacter sp.]